MKTQPAAHLFAFLGIAALGAANHFVNTATAAPAWQRNVHSISNGWQLTGNAGTSPEIHFLGTTDDAALELRANGLRALRLQPNPAAPNVIGGATANFVGPNVAGATIGGGGADNYADVDGITVWANGIMSHFGTIGGGFNNHILTDSFSSTIAGGYFNRVNANSQYSFIGGGSGNVVADGSAYSTISAGVGNLIGMTTFASTVGGGFGNQIGAQSYEATIGGGYLNTIAANSPYGTIPGGDRNVATNNAFAAGTLAKAINSGSFVWGDSTAAAVASTNADSVTMRAAGGYRLFSTANLTAGVFLAPGSGSWTALSDRKAKENIEPINARAILEKVTSLPVTTWNYKTQRGDIRHIGPMAQDFKAAFGLGETDTGITTVDADGVALAAIQGLNQKLEEHAAQLRAKDTELQSLKQRLNQLEDLLTKLIAKN